MHVVGGVAIAVDGDFPFTTGQSSSEAPDLTVRLTARRAEPPFRPAGVPAVEQDSWVAFVDGDRLSLCTKEPGEAMRIELGLTGLEGRYFYDKRVPFPYCYPMDALLVVHALGVAGGALMHAAAIAGRDGALLVAGPSGAGKTTMSRAAAAQGASVLSDERTILRLAPPERGGGWLLGGTPWPGEGNFADNRSVPLRGLILLEQADRDELVAVSPARALALLYRCHFPPAWDRAAAERTLSHLERAVREIPAFVFKNRKGPDAARLLLERVGGAPG
jgi:hypothetical protein